MSDYRVVKEDSGDCYLDVTFLHDFEEVKHIRCWVCAPLGNRGGAGHAA
jgi:hypothetical protein